jgi:hypothetical protein
MSGNYPGQPVDEMVQDQEEWWDACGVNQSIKWCMDNREAILALHSSEIKTKVFNRYECSLVRSNQSTDRS